MSSILVFVETSEDGFVAGSLGVLGKAKLLATELGAELDVVTVGPDVADNGASLGTYGATAVYAATTQQPTATVVADAVVAAANESAPQVILASASVLGAEVAGLVAGRLDIGVTTDGVDAKVVDGKVVVVRPAFDDNVYVDCTWAEPAGGGPMGVALFRAGSFSPQPSNGATSNVVALLPEASERQVEFVGRKAATGGSVDITKADVLVGAGRGLGGPDKFELVESLAKTLGGEVATTRAVVDAGWYDYATQVGQTGKTVSPKLYIAVGISGAIQHRVGMQSAGTIVAINKDPNAPIFEIADFGVVGDLFEVVPKLEDSLKGAS